MRTTITIDDDLYAKATGFMGIKEKSLLVSEGLKALIERESAKRLNLLAGSQPELELPPRRQSESTL